jgi:hypothetical protein
MRIGKGDREERQRQRQRIKLQFLLARTSSSEISITENIPTMISAEQQISPKMQAMIKMTFCMVYVSAMVANIVRFGTINFQIRNY